jgi:tellurite methyltransferase
MTLKDCWNNYWKDPSNHSLWEQPDKAVINLLEKIDHAKINKVLDLGCGIGRHSIQLAKAGFSVTALDVSSECLAVLRQKAQEEGSKIKIVEGAAVANLFPRNYYDMVIAFDVIYQGTRQDLETAIRTVNYWLKPGGLFFFTAVTRRDGKFNNGDKVAPNTFKSMNSVVPGETHYFSDENDILDLTRGFTLKEKKIDEHLWNNNGVKQTHSYWHVLAVKQ